MQFPFWGIIFDILFPWFSKSSTMACNSRCSYSDWKMEWSPVSTLPSSIKLDLSLLEAERHIENSADLAKIKNIYIYTTSAHKNDRGTPGPHMDHNICWFQAPDNYRRPIQQIRSIGMRWRYWAGPILALSFGRISQVSRHPLYVSRHIFQAFGHSCQDAGHFLQVLGPTPCHKIAGE